MIQEKMVRARRRYHHYNYNHHHQNNQNISSSTGGVGGGDAIGGGGGGGGEGGNGGGPRVGGSGNRHVLNHNHHQFHRSNKRQAHVPSAPSNTTQFIMNDHEFIGPDFDLMHNAIMEHYNRRKKRKSQNEQNESQQHSDEGSEKSSDFEAKITGSPNAIERQRIINDSQSIENDSPKKQHKNSVASTTTISTAATASPLRTATTTTSTILTRSPSKSPLKDVDDEESKNHHHHHDHHNLTHQNQQKTQQKQQQNQMQHNTNIKQTTTAMQLQESTMNVSQPTTPNYYYRPTGSPGDEDGLSPFINHEHLQSEFQEVYANIHTERLSSMSKHQLVDKYLLLEERVEELENRLRESQTASAAASHG